MFISRKYYVLICKIMKKFIAQLICMVFMPMLFIGNLSAQPEVFTVTLSANPPEYGFVAPESQPAVDGTPALIVAHPHKGYKFINWTENGEEVSVEPTDYIIVTRDMDLVANFVPATFEITVSSADPQYGVVSPSGVIIMQGGSLMTIIATPTPLYMFLNWTENDEEVSTNPVFSFTVTQDRNLVAHFAPATIEITLSKNIENGGTVNGAGIYPYGETVLVSAFTPSPEYSFDNWTEDGNVVSSTFIYAFTATKSRHLFANFIPAIYEIPVYANPYEGGTVSGGGVYTYGDQVTISAHANPDYQFLNWTKFTSGSGTVVSTKPDYTYEVTGDGWGNSAFVAYFAKKVEVTILINMPGGEVLGGGTYKYGDEVTVEAIPNPGYKFVNWAEGRGIVSTDNPYSFTVTESMVLLANFEEKEIKDIETVPLENIKIYPNPTTGELKVECGTLRVDGIDVFDMNGKKISLITSQISNLISINISDFPAGVYFIQLQTEQGNITKKFVKN